MICFSQSHGLFQTFAVRETDVSRHNGGTSGAPLRPLRNNSALIVTNISPGASKDAMFFSMHKFVGGVQTPGEFVFLFFLLTDLNCQAII